MSLIRFGFIKVLTIIILLIFTCLISVRNYQFIKKDPQSYFIKNWTSTNTQAIFESEFVNQPANLPSVHAVSFITLSNQQLLAFWFGGSREGGSDVKIWQSKYTNGQWSMARPIVSSVSIAQANNCYVSKVGNPLIYQGLDGTLYLFVISVSFGGWSGSMINKLISYDQGRTWSKPQRLILSPFLNISTLVRTNGISLTNGNFLVPAYHELIHKYPELLEFDKQGNLINQTRISILNHTLQPSMAVISDSSAMIYLRHGYNRQNQYQIYAFKTTDKGKNWQGPLETNLISHDASLVAARLPNGKFIMIYNSLNREKLALAVSNDGLKWKQLYLLENKSASEFSYPAIQLNDGIIDILYTWNRKKIKHVRFNDVWLNKEIANAKF